MEPALEAGVYRRYDVAVKYEKPGEEQKKKASICMRASAVTGYMTEIVAELNKELAAA